ncbi:hypothetical protein BGZ54_007894, partial [Gamsiella multidivaricata]
MVDVVLGTLIGTRLEIFSAEAVLDTLVMEFVLDVPAGVAVNVLASTVLNIGAAEVRLDALAVQAILKKVAAEIGLDVVTAEAGLEDAVVEVELVVLLIDSVSSSEQFSEPMSILDPS